MNQAADLLHLPDYAKTNGLQVRHLRLSLLLFLPHFIAQEDFSDRSIANPQRHANIGKKVSPLEAAYLVLALVQQKRNNAAFQVTPKEFRESVYARIVAKWKEHRDSKGVDPPAQPTLSQQVKSANGEEIERTAAYQMGQQPVSDLLTIPAKLMDTLLTSRKAAKQ